MNAHEAILKLAEIYVPKSYIKLVREIEERPMTTQEIAEFLGIHEDRAYKLVYVLRQAKVLCAVDYISGTTMKLKVYGLGSKDAKFEKKTPYQRCKEYRQRKRAKENADTLRVWGI